MNVFATGSTGYLGRAIIPALLDRGHSVKALARPESLGRVPAGAEPVAGDALDAASYSGRIAPADTFLQLVGVSHPGPGKAALFRSVDLESASVAAEASVRARIEHFVYVSVAHPAPAMKPYWQARAEAEEILRRTQRNLTILRPWYVLGPGHRWPYLLVPVYAMMELLPPTRESARRLGLVTLGQMVRALTFAVENPAKGTRVIEVGEIRKF